MTPFSESLTAHLLQRLGSPQHIEFAGFVREATKTVLSETAAQAVRRLWVENPWTVESNLDLVNWPGEPTWYELPGYLKNVNEGDNPILGFLLLPHPEDEGLYMVATAFETSTISARHCYAMALLDVSSLVDNAARARNFYSFTPDESAERIMSLVGVSISDDFRDELMILQDGNEEVIEAVMRDATSEIPILLSLLAAEAAENGFVLDLSENGTTVANLPLPTRSAVGRFADRFSRRLSSGLVRLPRRRRPPKLAWFS